MRSGAGLTPFNKNNLANSSGEKKAQWSFPRCIFFLEYTENLRSLKVSVYQ